MVVPVQEVRVGGGALGFAGIRAGVGPFLEQGTVEPLDLAVGLRPVGPGPLVLDRAAERGGEQLGAVGRAVVGERPGHGDAAVGEPGLRPRPEVDHGLLALVGEDLGVGQPGVVVDDVVQVGVAGGGGALDWSGGGAAVHSVPAAVGDPAELLDVHVHQLAGRRALVALRRRTTAADPGAGGRI